MTVDRNRLVAFAVVLSLLGLWFLRSSAGRGLRPSETLRAVAARMKLRPKPTPPPVAPPPPPVEAPPEAPLEVWVSLKQRWSASAELPMETVRLMMPESYWPHLDEAEWPELQSVQRLQGLLDVRVEETIRKGTGLFSESSPQVDEAIAGVDALLALGEEEGILGDTPAWEREPLDDPWALLHQAQLHRAAELFGMMDDERRRPSQVDGKTLSETAWIAGRLAELHPDHPAADYARLMLIEASQQDLWSEGADPQLAVDEVVSAVAEAEDPLVKEAAMVGFLTGSAEKLAGADTHTLLELLANEVDGLPQDLAQAVSLQALELAIVTDPTQIDGWLERVERAASDAEDAVVERSDVDGAYEDLARRGLREPRTWTAEIHARVAACARAGEPAQPDAILTAEATWDDLGWRFTEVTGSVFQGYEDDGDPLPPLVVDPPASLQGCLNRGPWSFLPPGDRLTLRMHGLDPN